MSTILVTGASGFVGSRLVSRLSSNHTVIALSRRFTEGAAFNYRGDFGSFEDLRYLDRHKIDVLVHLAAEMGGATEEAGLSVNLNGTRRLLRNMIDRGCRKFVLASSIAATGCLSPEFVPTSVPIPARHECLARDAYGFSKYLMEQMADYFSRLYPDAQLTSLRIGAIPESNATDPEPATIAIPSSVPFLSLGLVGVGDVLAGLQLVAEAGVRAGSRVCNLVGPDLRTPDKVSDMIRAAIGSRADHLDLTAYAYEGKLSPPLYSMREIFEEFGFRPIHSVASPQTLKERR